MVLKCISILLILFENMNEQYNAVYGHYPSMIWSWCRGRAAIYRHGLVLGIFKHVLHFWFSGGKAILQNSNFNSGHLLLVTKVSNRNRDKFETLIWIDSCSKLQYVIEDGVIGGHLFTYLLFNSCYLNCNFIRRVKLFS